MDKVIVFTPAELSNLIEESLRKVLSDPSIQKDEGSGLPELLSISQAAEYLNLAKQTLYGFTSKDEIPFLKRGKKLYFKRSELDNWLVDGKNEIGEQSKVKTLRKLREAKHDKSQS